VRGGYVHNHVLLDPIERKARQLGAVVDREAAITAGGRVLYGDLLIRNGSRQVLVEVEMSSRRVPNDLAKAMAQAACLWIVVPNARVAESVRRKLSRHETQPQPRLFVLSLPQALQRLEAMIELNSGSNVERKRKKKPVGERCSAEHHSTRAEEER
jgi:uncharacterized glyoxalase superfamily metalloenzyme YdcJ